MRFADEMAQISIKSNSCSQHLKHTGVRPRTEALIYNSSGLQIHRDENIISLQLLSNSLKYWPNYNVDVCRNRSNGPSEVLNFVLGRKIVDIFVSPFSSTSTF